MQKTSNTQDKASKSWAIKLDGPLLILLCIIGIAALTRSLFNFGVWETLKAPVFGSTTASVIVLFICLIKSKNSKHTIYNALGTSIAVGIVALVFSSMMISIGAATKELVAYLWVTTSENYKFSLGVGLCTFLVGSIFFYIRLRWRVTYGFSEAMAGVLIASYRAHDLNGEWPTQSLDFYVIMLTAGIYLVVRGLDNINQGKNQSDDPLVIIVSWLREQVSTDDAEKVAKMYGRPKPPPRNSSDSNEDDMKPK